MTPEEVGRISAMFPPKLSKDFLLPTSKAYYSL